MLKSTLKIIIIFTLTSHIVAEQDYPCWQRGGIKDTTLSICDYICCCGDKALGEKQLCQNITTSEGTSAVIQEGTIQEFATTNLICQIKVVASTPFMIPQPMAVVRFLKQDLIKHKTQIREMLSVPI